MLIAIILNNLEDAQAQYNKLIQRKKQPNAKPLSGSGGATGGPNGLSDINNKNLPGQHHSHHHDKTNNLSQKRVMEEYNRAFQHSNDREKQLTLQYFMDLAAIENELSTYQNQMDVLNHLVDKLREQE